MRYIKSHKVEGAATEIDILVTDEPGHGGANHSYLIHGFEEENNPSLILGHDGIQILFQNGPVGESGMNGLTNESLIAVVIDRLEGFQSGPYACEDNQEALLSLYQAMLALQRRTVERVARQVEGTSQK